MYLQKPIYPVTAPPSPLAYWLAYVAAVMRADAVDEYTAFCDLQNWIRSGGAIPPAFRHDKPLRDAFILGFDGYAAFRAAVVDRYLT